MSSNSIYSLPYVYKIVDKETGEFYIGSRHKNVSLGLAPEEDFMVRYFSSGSLKSKLQDDALNFECSIIFRSGESEAAYWYEQLLIRENIENPLCVNKHYIDPDTGKNSFSMGGKIRGPHSDDTKKKISNSLRGNVVSDKTKMKLKIARSKRVFTDETRRKISASLSGKIKSESHKENLRNREVPEFKCPHCGKEGKSGVMKRWHFDNCRGISL